MTKRVVHYLILASVLLGVPLACCVLGGREDVLEGVATFPASSLFWWFFEYLNRYVWNWYYVGISELGAVEYAVYATVCFASVIPAVCAVAAWLHTFPVFDDRVYGGMARVDLRKPGWCASGMEGTAV